MKAEILTIGDELLRGEIVDSNKSFLSDRLLQLDIETRFHASVRDDPADMIDAFHRGAKRSDVVLISGGLGPTRDDLTAEVLAQAFDRAMVLDEEALAGIRAFFASVGREMTDNNASQAHFPEGAEVLANPIGTAPGFCLEARDTLFFCMPGVPREMHRMMDEQVLPRLAARSGDRRVVRATLLRTFGIGESTLDAELSDLARGDDVSLGFRTSFPDNYLRPLVRADDVEAAESKLAELSTTIRERLGAIVYGEGDATLQEVVVRELEQKRTTLAVAESCTGGMIGAKLVDVPGASHVFLGGVVAYANSAKRDLLGVDPALLEEHGAVSEPVARAMAEGVRARFGSDFGVATTGIAGPAPEGSGRPDGLVHMAFADGTRTHADHFVFPLDRMRHRQLTTQVALDWIRRALLGEELVGPSLLRRTGGGSAPGSRS